MTSHRSITRSATVALAALTLCLSNAGAQAGGADARWEPWLGCWQAGSATDAMKSPVVCVSSLSGAAVEVATVTGGKISARDTIDANGERRVMNTKECTGWRRADWSADSRRVYINSQLSCNGSETRTSTGMIAMSSGGEWLDIQSASANGNSGVRSARYFEVGPGFVDLPPELANPITARARLPYTARALAGSGVSSRDVIEAVTRVDSLVVESWLVERGQKFNLDRKTLASLADAGVPGSITDVMIATSFPERFALQRSGEDRARGGNDVQAGYNTSYGSARAMMSRCSSAWDPMWYAQSPYDMCGAGYAYRGGYYGYDPYDYYYGPYRYGAYGYGGVPYYGGYSSPVIIVKDPGQPELPHGRVINGQGYTRNTRGSTGAGDTGSEQTQSTSRGAATSGSTGRSSGSSGSSSSSGKSSSGSSSSGSSSTGRTAQRRGGS